MAEDSSSTNTDVFIYTEGSVVPQDVVRVRVHPSVIRIPEHLFYEQKKLEEVELCEGLLEIGAKAFFGCHSLKNIKIPSTVTAIGDSALGGRLQSQIRLHDGIESIGTYAFSCSGNITNFRVPPLIASTSRGMFSGCIRMFSVEILESVTEIESLTFSSCRSLRNMTIPPSAEVQWDAFGNGGIHYHLFVKISYNYSVNHHMTLNRHQSPKH